MENPDQLVLVLGDQLSPGISALRDADPERTAVLMCEVLEECTYAPHHRKKIAFVLSAMRHFAEELRSEGWHVDYVRLDDEGNTGSLTGELARAAERWEPGGALVTAPGEWRLAEALGGWEGPGGLRLEIREDDRFLCPTGDFEDWARGRKSFRMEHFYRMMRRRTGLLMDGDEPAGGRWNFDAENREPAEPDLDVPGRREFGPDETTRAVLDLVARRFSDNFGTLEPFRFAVTRADAEKALDHFVEHALPRFGDYQDAMLADERFLYHSVLSGYMNVGLLDPLAVCRAAEAAWRDGHAPLNAVEGFIRQILGWREYVRGIYWHAMPDYAGRNHLGAERPLPWFYWSGETGMACVRAVVTQTREEAYAHHIQRLMVTGTFALLAGVAPREVHEWYLGVYFDAFEWAELPNVLGMSQFADGGLLGSKPYAASGSYVNRMSDYCGGCRYDVKKRTGEEACPFNALYWDFLVRNRNRLKGNRRLGPVYATWDRMKDETRKALRQRASDLLENLEKL